MGCRHAERHVPRALAADFVHAGGQGVDDGDADAAARDGTRHHRTYCRRGRIVSDDPTVGLCPGGCSSTGMPGPLSTTLMPPSGLDGDLIVVRVAGQARQREKSTTS